MCLSPGEIGLGMFDCRRGRILKKGSLLFGALAWPTRTIRKTISLLVVVKLHLRHLRLISIALAHAVCFGRWPPCEVAGHDFLAPLILFGNPASEAFGFLMS
jgi:hypothetical protein